MFKTGWNVRIARLVTQALQKNEYEKINLCDRFHLFFADFSVLDITWTFEEWGHSNFPLEQSSASRSRRHLIRWPFLRNFLVTRLWILAKKTEMKFPEEID